jgi:hypothetical protein
MLHITGRQGGSVVLVAESAPTLEDVHIMSPFNTNGFHIYSFGKPLKKECREDNSSHTKFRYSYPISCHFSSILHNKIICTIHRNLYPISCHLQHAPASFMLGITVLKGRQGGQYISLVNIGISVLFIGKLYPTYEYPPYFLSLSACFCSFTLGLHKRGGREDSLSLANLGIGTLFIANLHPY